MSHEAPMVGQIGGPQVLTATQQARAIALDIAFKIGGSYEVADRIAVYILTGDHPSAQPVAAGSRAYVSERDGEEHQL